ncbi:MAG: hypothetical protein ACQEUT_16060 [Bacillota bacterium]
MNKWLIDIIPAIKNLGGVADLESIYEEFSKSTDLNLESYIDWKSQVRKNIYLHSSDCDIFRGEVGDGNDIFFSAKGKGKGHWGIRK